VDALVDITTNSSGTTEEEETSRTMLTSASTSQEHETETGKNLSSTIATMDLTRDGTSPEVEREACHTHLETAKNSRSEPE
jgi:hypothetical protein